MAPRTRAQARAKEVEPSSDPNTIETDATPRAGSTATLVASQSPSISAQSDTEETLQHVQDRPLPDLNWKGKISTTFKAVRDVEYMLHVYAEKHDEPKLDALKVMLDTIVTCLVGGGNVHTFMDDPEWVRAHSSKVRERGVV